MKRTISIQEKNKLFDLLVSMYNNLNIKNIHMFQTALKKLGFNIQHVDCILELIDKRLLTRDKFNILLTYRMRDDMFYEFLNASDEKIDDYVEQLKEIEDWEKMISKIINDLAQHEHMDLKIGPNDINDEKITILAEAITYDTIEIDDIIWLLKGDIMLNTNNNDFNNLIYFFTVFNGIKDIKLQEQLLDWPINNIENKADIQDIIEEKTATLCEEYKDKLSDEQIVCFLSAIKYYHSLDFKERKTINEYIYMKRYETKARNSQENNVIKFPSEK